MTPAPFDLAAHVARHAAGLRQLALELVGDSGADDAVQETWLAAMLHWPRHDASIGGWLATTLRNVVRGSRPERPRSRCRRCSRRRS
jgi:DNA-directed RNA polymerase specialized sigma24 family protein